MKKCRFLRVAPAQLPRIEVMTANATERLAEAKDRVWLGEVAAQEDSLKHLRSAAPKPSSSCRRQRRR